jgi:hypothetical protein
VLASTGRREVLDGARREGFLIVACPLPDFLLDSVTVSPSWPSRREADCEKARLCGGRRVDEVSWEKQRLHMGIAGNIGLLGRVPWLTYCRNERMIVDGEVVLK